MKRLSAFAFVFLLGAVPVFARPRQSSNGQAPGKDQLNAPGSSVAPAAPAKIDPAKEADIRQLLELTGAKAIATQSMDSMETTLKPLLINSLPPGDYRTKLVDLWFEKFRTKINMQQMIDGAVPLYDKYLSDDEIKGLIVFYRTPLGQKAVSVIPRLSAELQAENTKLGQDVGRQAMMEVLSENPDLAKALTDAQKGAHTE